MLTDRLANLDEFGSRKFVIPAEVKGPLRKWRTRVYWILLTIFMALPWIRINGLQAVWIDIPRRHFEIFGQLFSAHDTPLIFLLIGFFVLMLAFTTAVWGRVWCGWACPQTVFIDIVYRNIEILIEGNYLARRKLRAQEMSFEKLFKTSCKWFLYFLVSSLFAHSLIAYFAGGNNLIAMLYGAPKDNWSYFVIVTLVTALLMFNFGWFREQFCVIMCPYGRFQSVLMDPNSVTVAYDQARGEPRKGTGDCVACNRCVQVCPTGIDIRDGVQMDCVACTACIDACNDIMAKVDKSPNLIAYRNLTGNAVRFTRPRALIYLILATFCAVSFAFAFLGHGDHRITILRATDTPYQIMPDGSIMNHFKVHYINQSQHSEEFSVQLPENEINNGVKLTQSSTKVLVASGASSETHFFLTFPNQKLKQGKDGVIDMHIFGSNGLLIEKQSIPIIGPEVPH